VHLVVGDEAMMDESDVYKVSRREIGDGLVKKILIGGMSLDLIDSW
jgi:hypothetical protein